MAIIQGEAVTIINAATATTTSSSQSLKKALRVGFEFTRADHSAGSSKFEVLGSFDGVTYTEPVMLVTNGANSITEGLVRVLSTTLAANGVEFYWLDSIITLHSIKVKVTETTDGTHTAKMITQTES